MCYRKPIIFLFYLLSLVGCTLGHPVKTTEKINKENLVGKFKFQDEFQIELKSDGSGVQEIGDKKFMFNWEIVDNCIEITSLYGKNNGMDYKNYGKQKYIISSDYRDFYYPFGSLDGDFDNYEIFELVK